MMNSLEFAKQMDEEDKLKHFRQRFIIPSENGKEKIYFLGNSLGLQPKTTASYIDKILDQWSQYGVEGFFEGDDPWLSYHEQLTSSLAEIVGALPHEVVAMNQLTVNLHLMMVSFYRPKGKRNKILCEGKAFPSDQYMFETQVKHFGLDPADIIIEVLPREGEHTLRTEDILSSIQKYKDELAIVLFGGVNYYTGQLFDIKSITDEAHRVGAIAAFDLAHAAGNVRLQLHDWDVDFACWCSYKYLNSGPGAIGGAFVHERYHDAPDLNRFAGWWGYQQETRFEMRKGFVPIDSAEGWQLSTPSFILFTMHKASLDIFKEASIESILQKGRRLNEFLFFILDDINHGSSKNLIEILTPLSLNERGCQVSMLMKNHGREIFNRLRNQGIFADWREPNVIRIAPVPLYNSFEEVWKFGQILESELRSLEGETK